MYCKNSGQNTHHTIAAVSLFLTITIILPWIQPVQGSPRHLICACEKNESNWKWQIENILRPTLDRMLRGQIHWSGFVRTVEYVMELDEINNCRRGTCKLNGWKHKGCRCEYHLRQEVACYRSKKTSGGASMLSRLTGTNIKLPWLPNSGGPERGCIYYNKRVTGTLHGKQCRDMPIICTNKSGCNNETTTTAESICISQLNLHGVNGKPPMQTAESAFLLSYYHP